MISHDNSQDGNAVIHNVLPRKTSFKRLSAGNGNQEQMIAANIDIVFICVSLNNNYNLNRIERYLSAEWNSGGLPVVILTKSDLCNDLDNKVNEVSSIALGADVIAATSKDSKTCEKIISYLKAGVTASFIGSSSVGKSTLSNRLAGKGLFETQDIRHDNKGRHTTIRRELIILPNGAAIQSIKKHGKLEAWAGNYSRS
jgi:ribosome biogenesis GTPase